MSKKTDLDKKASKNKYLKEGYKDLKAKKMKKFNDTLVQTKNFTRNSFNYYQESLSVL